MKKTYAIFWMCLLALMPVLQACDDDEGYSVGDFTPPLWATVRTQGMAFYLDCDVWGTLWPVNTNLAGYQAVDGQRVIASFNPIYDDFQGYDHAVKILTMQNVLTKQVESLTPENEADYGDDPMLIYQGDMHVSFRTGYLNLIFYQNLPSREKHRVSLVQSDEDVQAYEDDGYLHYQLRYNDYDDLTGYRAFGAVSFSLWSPDEVPAAMKGVKVRLCSEKNGEVEVTFDRAQTGDAPSTQADISGMMLK